MKELRDFRKKFFRGTSRWKRDGSWLSGSVDTSTSSILTAPKSKRDAWLRESEGKEHNGH